MQSRERFWAAALLGSGLLGLLGVVSWFAEPEPLRAEGQTESPFPTCPASDWFCGFGGSEPVYADWSLIFVIDSSTTMTPPIGESYFDLAKNGIVEYLSGPGIPIDGSLQVSVIQFGDTTIEHNNYKEGVHWVRPVPILPGTLDDLIVFIANLQPTTHFTGSLIEMGLREARRVAEDRSTSDAYTKHRIILMSTGEYRLPPPCPPPCFSYVNYDDANMNCNGDINWTGIEHSRIDTDTDLYDKCNRAYAVRFHVDRLLDAGYFVSTMGFGPEWNNTAIVTYSDAQDFSAECTYGLSCSGAFDYNAVYCPDEQNSNEALPQQPDRRGFQKEIANWGNEDGTTGCEPHSGLYGAHGRIDPFYCFGCGIEYFEPPTPQDVADMLSAWVCDKWQFGTDMEGVDGDGVYSFCDNCPNTPNPDQRDCNQDGIGDACQLTSSSCSQNCGSGSDPCDSDGDGLCDDLDTCDGGDDCLVAMWRRQLGCTEDGKGPKCEVDCDHDGVDDLCSAAREFGWLVPPYAYLEDGALGGPTGIYGIPACCQSDPPDCTDDGASETPPFCDNAPCACDHVPDVCNIPDSGYKEGFEVIPASESIGEQGRGWTMSEGVSSGAAKIINLRDDELVADLNLTVYPELEEYPYHDEQALAVTIDQSTSMDGGSIWAIHGPGFYVPPGESDTCINPGAADVVAVRFNVLVKTDANGPSFDIVIGDPDYSDPFDYERVRLRFSGPITPTVVDGQQVMTGIAWIATDTPQGNCPIEEGFQELGAFPYGEWLHLSVVINSGAHYANSTAMWNGGGESVKVLHYDEDYRKVGCAGSGGVLDTYYELGSLAPHQTRRVQLVIESDNFCDANEPGQCQDPNEYFLLLDDVEVKTSDMCFWADGRICYANCDCGSNSMRCDGWVSGGNCSDPQYAASACGNSCLTENEECDIEVGYAGTCCGAPKSPHCEHQDPCTWMCGDERVQNSSATNDEARGTEQCDRGIDYAPEYGNCLTDCTWECGDGFVQNENFLDFDVQVETGTEQCDPPGVHPEADNAMCSADCTWEEDDGIVTLPWEQCDTADPSPPSQGNCQSDATWECGDGYVQGPNENGTEQCDTGISYDPAVDGTCLGDCTWECGDSVVQASSVGGMEQCDTGIGYDPAIDGTCLADCTWECGDGIVQSSTVGGTEECDMADPAPPASGTCLSGCTWECGDGVVQGPSAGGNEQCDSGIGYEPAVDGTCLTDCTWECGDGVVQGPSVGGTEECDPPSLGCTSSCKIITFD